MILIFIARLFWRLLPYHIDLLSSSKAGLRQWWRHDMSTVLKVLRGFKYYQWQVLKGFKYYQWQISFGSRRNAAMQAPLASAAGERRYRAFIGILADWEFKFCSKVACTLPRVGKKNTPKKLSHPPIQLWVWLYSGHFELRCTRLLCTWGSPKLREVARVDS